MSEGDMIGYRYRSTYTDQSLGLTVDQLRGYATFMAARFRASLFGLAHPVTNFLCGGRRAEGAGGDVPTDFGARGELSCK